MANTYSAKECTLEVLLTDYKKLEVPPFQRPYQWGDDELNDLFEDIVNYDWHKHDVNTPKDTHFMGALVFCKSNNPKSFLILDGQQRLTTLTILIAVLSDKLKELSADDENKKEYARRYRDVLFSERRSIRNTDGVPLIKPQDDDERIYSLIITGKEDDLRLALQNSADGKKLLKRKIFKAYEFLKSKVNSDIVKKAGEYERDPYDIISYILDKLYENLAFVVIESEDESAAFRLFETLNGRGLDLSAADLIKNKLFSICRPLDLEYIKKMWPSLTGVDNVGDDLVAFFRTKWLADNSIRRKNKDGDIEQHEFIRKDDLFEAYRDYFDLHKSKNGFIKKIFDDLMVSAEAYNEIISPGPKSEYKKELDAINALGAKTCRPLLMIVYLKDKSIFRDVARLIEHLTVRWIVSKQVTNVLETSYARIASNVSEMFQNSVSSSEVLAYIDKELHKLDVPNNNKFESDFSQWRPNNTSKLARYILCEINKYGAPTRELNVSGTDDVQVEHIFPQSPSVEAMEESRIPEDEVETWSGLIGNLTLLDATINNHLKNDKFSKKISVSNDPKKSTLADSVLAINQGLKSKKTWRRDDIIDRSKEFALVAVKIWKW